ncbi:MAG: decaprenyl-phosphate phosphoribosyltransferase [Bacteroidota bacterium]
MNAFLTLLRPRQWLKNLFLLAPLIFSRHLFQGDFLLSGLLAFASFCLLSSAVYAVNDVADRESDRLHPLKRGRPVATGTISVAVALGIAAGLLMGTALLASFLPWKFQVVCGVYFVLNLGYSFWLKQVILIDVFVISAGFMLRVLGGAFAIQVEVSDWLVLCTMFLALFLAVSRRRGEFLLMEHAGGFSERPVLREYDVAYIDQLLTIAAAGCAIAYALYTVADRTVRMFETENLIFTTVFVLLGIFRYLFLLRRRKSEENPMNLLLSDPFMVINIGAWFVSCVVIKYWKAIVVMVLSSTP